MVDAPPSSQPERRGMDTAVIAFVESLHQQEERRIEQFLESHAEVHQEFVRTHEREHGLRAASQADALELSRVRLHETRTHYDALLVERDRRLNERFAAQERANETARVSIEKAVDAAFSAHQEQQAQAFAGQKEANERQAISVLEQTKANYVRIEELQRLYRDVIPRNEIENRLIATADMISDLRDRVKAVESAKAGRADMLPYVSAAIAIAAFVYALTR